MVLLINTSNLWIGGGIQVALSFIHECIHFNENEYHVFLSPIISSQINQKEYPENFSFYLISNKPSSLMHGMRTIHQLSKLENMIKPDCVFTVFGPSFWTPKSPHILGFAQGHFLYAESPFFKMIRPAFALKIKLLRIVHHFFFKKNANYYYVESNDAKARLALFLNKSQDNIAAFSNTYNSVFNPPYIRSQVLPPKNFNEIRLVTISSYYVHKNLEIIKSIIPYLKQKSNLKFTFILTIEKKIFEKKFKASEDTIINLGPIPIDLCPGVYQECDIMFLPSLIEIFTASYPEAMKMMKPILTSDLSFAHDICGDAAEYFDPLNPEDIADKIIYLVSDTSRQKELIQNGEQRLQCFETPASRAKKLLEVCEKIIKMESII